MKGFAVLPALLALAAVAVPLRASGSSGGAESLVRERLAAKNIAVGADVATGRYVFIGMCPREMSDPVAEPKFPRLRRECAEVAELAAKRDILCAYRMRVNAHDEVSFHSDGETSERTTASVMEVLSEESLSGASVVASAESWDAATGLYQVAVAVAWTKKLVAAAVDSTPPTAPVSEEEDQAEWDRWLEGIDLSIALGMRQFVDSRGLRRFAGIGCADVEGKAGAALNAARIVAETEAKASLALGLYGDSEMQSVATKTMVERESSSGELSADAWATFVGKIRARCRNKQLRGRVVRSETVVHPVTGRHMLVCVYGMTAADQAEMNQLNNNP